MKYYKNLQGAVIAAEDKPVGAWREVSERDYNNYRAYVARLLSDLEKAVAYKRAVLRT